MQFYYKVITHNLITTLQNSYTTLLHKIKQLNTKQNKMNKIIVLLLCCLLPLCSSQTTGKNTSQIICPIGCTNQSCHSSYTCSQKCGANYEDDGTCMTCKWANPWDNVTEFYIESDEIEKLNEVKKFVNENV